MEKGNTSEAEANEGGMNQFSQNRKMISGEHRQTKDVDGDVMLVDEERLKNIL